MVKNSKQMNILEIMGKVTAKTGEWFPQTA
jgi:hypothetical protein